MFALAGFAVNCVVKKWRSVDSFVGWAGLR